MITADDYELAEVALAAADGVEAVAMRMLRDECGWTLRHALNMLRLIQAAGGRPGATPT
jgi:hypothetical protein